MAKTKLKTLYGLMQTEYEDSDIDSMLIESGYISFEKEYQFIENVVNNCFDGMLNYQPEYFSLAMFINALHFYYGIKHNNEKCLVDMLYGKDAYGKSISNVLLSKINQAQLDNIKRSASFKIDDRLQRFRKYVNTPTEDLMEKIGEAVDNVNALLNNFGQFSSLDKDSTMEMLNKITNVIGDNEFSESNIVNAILDQKDFTQNTPEHVDLG